MRCRSTRCVAVGEPKIRSSYRPGRRRTPRVDAGRRSRRGRRAPLLQQLRGARRDPARRCCGTRRSARSDDAAQRLAGCATPSTQVRPKSGETSACARTARVRGSPRASATAARGPKTRVPMVRKSSVSARARSRCRRRLPRDPRLAQAVLFRVDVGVEHLGSAIRPRRRPRGRRRTDARLRAARAPRSDHPGGDG